MGAYDSEIERKDAGMGKTELETRLETGVVGGFTFEKCEIYKKGIPKKWSGECDGAPEGADLEDEPK